MMGQRNKIRLAALGIFLITILAIFLDFPEYIEKTGIDLPDFFNQPFLLGLDLQGGTHLIYEADVSQIPDEDRDSSVEGVRDVIERRVNAFGVAEPIVQTTKTKGSWRIIVELAGISDVSQAINMIGETPLLEFKEQNPNPQVELTDDQRTEMEKFNNGAKTLAEDILAQALKPNADFATLAKENTQDPGTIDTGGDLGFAARGLYMPEFETVCYNDLKPAEIHQALIKTQFGYHIIKKEEERGEGETYEVRCRHILIRTINELDVGEAPDEWLYTGLTGKQLKRAQVEFDPNTRMPQIALEFNDEGTDLFAKITERNVGKGLAIFLDGLSPVDSDGDGKITPNDIYAPIIQEPITGGKAVISGNMDINRAKGITRLLKSGALPVPINLISQQTIGASLGNESVEKSLKAGILGLIIICLFMILYYRLPGLTAVVTLIFYGLVVLAIFKLIPVTLTLAGMAGFILSLGMAVDANILIFERFKEELKQDKPLPIALEEGFKRAWPSIFDGNISTLITCLILMGFTTSLVKGFAVTLSIGILISMFSAMVVTKLILKTVIKYKVANNLWLFGVRKKTTN